MTMTEDKIKPVYISFCVFVIVCCGVMFAWLAYSYALPGKSHLLKYSAVGRVTIGMFLGLFAMPVGAVCLWRWQVDEDYSLTHSLTHSHPSREFLVVCSYCLWALLHCHFRP